MKTIITLLFSLMISRPSLAQVDSIGSASDIIGTNASLDTISNQFPNLPDSPQRAYNKIDSIQNTLRLDADSLQDEYSISVSMIDDKTAKINKSIDSLTRLDLPTHQYKGRLDSLRNLRENMEQKFSAKLEALKSDVKKELNSIDVPDEYREPLQKLSQSLDDVDLDSDFENIPALKVPGYSGHAINGYTGLPDDIGVINTKIPTEVPSGHIDGISKQVKGYNENIEEVASGNLDRLGNLPKTIEQQATKINGMDELQKTSGRVDAHRARFDKLADQKKAKGKVAEMAQKAAVDHFAGEQEQLKSAMEKVSKYKQKYSSVSSIKELPKRPPNPLKGKPFVERLVPGIYFQYQHKTFYLADVNLYLGYKATEKITSGLGWNQRYAYNKTVRKFNKRARIFGPRAYLDFQLGKGFIAHIEGESMNTFVPSTLNGNPDTGHREWVWSIMTGIKKEYKIYGNLKGTALIQYNLFNREYKAPYISRLNSRIGFEYVLKYKGEKVNK